MPNYKGKKFPYTKAGKKAWKKFKKKIRSKINGNTYDGNQGDVDG